MKKQLLLFVMMLLPMIASADPVEIDGIYYNLTAKTKTAAVTSKPGYYSGNIIIPAKINYESIEYDVTSIGQNAFISCADLTSVSIPNSITKIDFGAFTGCSSLTTITIPNSVTNIGGCAFMNCI